jgi:acetyl-CoA carboxylase biotin carboxyl carrier protein
VTDAFRSLTDDEVRQIGLIIESLDHSTFDFLQLEFGDVKLTIGKGQPPSTLAAAAQNSPAPTVAASETASSVSTTRPGAAPAIDKSSKNIVGQADGTNIVAPLLGRFYAQPEPGAAPFVSVGSPVTEDTTVGLIEVMKTFNAVRAGISGVITEICVQDAQLVEYGELLFRVQPQQAT